MSTLVAAAVMLGPPSHAARASVAIEADVATITITTDAPRWVETEIPIALAPTTRVLAMGIDTDWKTFVARGEPIADARAHFALAHELPLDVLTGKPRDPALLEQTEHGIVLHVFPVARGHATTVRLYLDTPLAPSDWMHVDWSRHVPMSAETALYAGPIVQIEPPKPAGEPPRTTHRGLRPHVALVPEAHLERLHGWRAST